jgi:ribosome maturation factor RimP
LHRIQKKRQFRGQIVPCFFAQMINNSTVRQLAEEHLADTDIFLVDITVSATNKISVYIDRDENIVIKDCLGLSRHIEGNLDREIEDYELEVS